MLKWQDGEPPPVLPTWLLATVLITLMILVTCWGYS